MILGDTCTRSCRFCAVKSGRAGPPPDPAEGEGIARAAEELGLRYVVLTSVDRDDLPGRGADHFAACVAAVKRRIPGIKVEVLVPDYTAVELRPILEAAPEVIAHNVETVRSLQRVRDRRASFDKSLAALRAVKAAAVVGGASPGFTAGAASTGAAVDASPGSTAGAASTGAAGDTSTGAAAGVPPAAGPASKSSLLLGLGETEGEVLAAMDELRAAAVDILVLGQYLRPGKDQLPVVEYVSPEQFRRYAAAGRERGFAAVEAAPLARTSYHAGNLWNQRIAAAGNGSRDAPLAKEPEVFLYAP
jgi:lipoic acid synthetase